MNKIRIAAVAAGLIGCCSTLLATPVMAQQQVLNLYSSRHYQTDEALYANFEKATDIKVNRIEGPEDPLIERLKSEGDKSPADLLITVDMGRLMKAQQLGGLHALPAEEIKFLYELREKIGPTLL